MSRVCTPVTGAAIGPWLMSLLIATPAEPASVQAAAEAPASYAAVVPRRAIQFPADYGSHPNYRTEWWYVTGWLSTHGGESLGFQVTFFRSRPAIDEGNPSAFTPRQLMIAHCAISDPKRGRLWQDQKIRRAGFDLAQAAEGDTDLRIDRWTLKRGGNNYTAVIGADGFSLQLTLTPTQPPLLNGISGLSSKGPAPEQASYYYSLPHIKVEGSISRDGIPEPVQGEAWFDHEWSSEYLAPDAIGWDWIGINLDDGGALMAFRIRGPRGQPVWAGATLRGADGNTRYLAPADVQFIPQRSWRSPRTGTSYPIAWQVQVGPRRFDLVPLMDDQENDTRVSTGAIYWEGAVRALEAQRPIGRGYLELTGYAERLRLR